MIEETFFFNNRNTSYTYRFCLQKLDENYLLKIITMILSTIVSHDFILLQRRKVDTVV